MRLMKYPAFASLTLIAAFACLFLVACEPGSPPQTNAKLETGDIRTFHMKGVVREISPDGTTATIAHEEVPGFMVAMVMPLTVKDRSELAGLSPGDEIVFRLSVSKEDDWIDQVVKTGERIEVPPPGPESLMAGEELEVGDPVPDITLTNDVNQVVRLSDLRGRTVALTFIFTRCPLPTYCPLMSRNFADAHQVLLDTPGLSPDWRFLSISFDPGFDTPQVLHNYAGQYRPTNHRWDFLTTDDKQIQRLGAPLGLRLVREPGTINHNLRTVVLGKDGRIHRIFRDNLWEGEELAEAMQEAEAAFAETVTTQMALEGMSCQGCADTVQSGLLTLAGVITAEVNLTNRLAKIRHLPDIVGVDQLVSCVTNLNYGASPLH